MLSDNLNLKKDNHYDQENEFLNKMMSNTFTKKIHALNKNDVKKLLGQSANKKSLIENLEKLLPKKKKRTRKKKKKGKRKTKRRNR